MIAHALSEIGVPLIEPYPKPLTDEVVRASDIVITCRDRHVARTGHSVALPVRLPV